MAIKLPLQAWKKRLSYLYSWRPYDKSTFGVKFERNNQAEIVYHKMIRQLQREMLIMFIFLQLVFGSLICLQFFIHVWVEHIWTQALFFVQTGQLLLLLLSGTFFLRRDMVRIAWANELIITISAIYAVMWLLHEPGVLITTVFILAGFSVIFPFYLTISIVTVLMVFFFSIVYLLDSNYTSDPGTILIVTLITILGFAFVGIVTRRFIKRLAYSNIQHETEIIEKTRLAQQLADTTEQIEQLNSLEHDIRQPLRSIQGHISLLALENPDSSELIGHVIAASQRADRLLNNFLDLTRMKIQQVRSVRELVDLNEVFKKLEIESQGISSYYTEPPVEINFQKTDLPQANIDGEQFERAFLNLIDNAVVHSPRQGRIEVAVSNLAQKLQIKIRDEGPGIPDKVINALQSKNEVPSGRKSRAGLGLTQVYKMIDDHQGTIDINNTNPGTVITITIPLTPKE